MSHHCRRRSSTAPNWAATGRVEADFGEACGEQALRKKVVAALSKAVSGVVFFRRPACERLPNCCITSKKRPHEPLGRTERPIGPTVELASTLDHRPPRVVACRWDRMALGVSSLVTRTLRLLLTWLCLVSPWLALASVDVLLVEPSAPTEERDSSGEELEKAALSGARRAPKHRHTLRPLPSRTHEWPRSLTAPRHVAAPPQASTSYRAPAKILLRRVPPQGEDPLS